MGQFSTDGKLLVAVSQDRTVSIYDVASRVRLGDPIPIELFTPSTASVRPDGTAVAIGDGNGIAIWDVNPEHLQTAACKPRRTQPHPHRMERPPLRTRRLPTDLPRVQVTTRPRQRRQAGPSHW